MRVGAHLRSRGGLMAAFDSARTVGADAFQLFASNPRAWAGPNPPPEVVERWRASHAEWGGGEIWFHAPYVVNIASPNPEFHAKSVALAGASVRAADTYGTRGVVVHAGAGGPGEPAQALVRAGAGLRAIAAEGSDALVAVELMAGSSGAVASTFEEAARLFDAAGAPDRMVLCIDTCHLFAAGYGLDTAEGAAEAFAALRSSGLASRLALVHANDAKFERGSRRDRHENVGQGSIGETGFEAILAQPEVRGATVLCETPGGPEDTARDVALLKSLAARVAA